MQLKRILARDSRSATDQAIALYGADVLIISNHQVNGQTELVVALDVSAADPLDRRGQPALGMVAGPSASADALPRVSLGQPAPAAGAGDFLKALRLAEKTAVREGQDAYGLTDDLEPTVTKAQEVKAQDARDYLRGREIVDLVRDELASLRREFRLTQQTAGWQQGLNMADDVKSLARAVTEAAMPQALRALLLDTLQEHSEPATALAAFKSQLEHTLARPGAALPSSGVHALAGPSGAGKSLMAVRLASHAAQQHGPAQVALISYSDVRAGAWSQLQMLAAQLGVDCFRANDAGTLALLLNELSPRRLVLIDTPGVQMAQRLAEVRATHTATQCHAVVPADASSATLARLLGTAPDKGADAPAPRWDSLLVSKLDECTQPWALLHFLSNNPLALAGGSEGASADDLLDTSPVARLVSLGTDNLQAAAHSLATESAGLSPVAPAASAGLAQAFSDSQISTLSQLALRRPSGTAA